MAIHEAIQSSNFDEYKKFVSTSATSFEPNAKGILIEGLDFQKFYLNEPNKVKITVVNPKVKILSKTSAMTTCTLLHQRMSAGSPVRIGHENRMNIDLRIMILKSETEIKS